MGNGTRRPARRVVVVRKRGGGWLALLGGLLAIGAVALFVMFGQQTDPQPFTPSVESDTQDPQQITHVASKQGNNGKLTTRVAREGIPASDSPTTSLSGSKNADAPKSNVRHPEAAPPPSPHEKALPSADVATRKHQEEQQPTPAPPQTKDDTSDESIAFSCIRVALRPTEAEATLRSETMRGRIKQAFAEVKIERPQLIKNIAYHLEAVKEADRRIKSFKIEKPSDRMDLIKLESVRKFNLKALSTYSSAVGVMLYTRASNNESFPSKEHLEYKKELTRKPRFYVYSDPTQGPKVSLFPDVKEFDSHRMPSWDSEREVAVLGRWEAPKGTTLYLNTRTGQIRTPTRLVLVTQKENPATRGWVSPRNLRFGPLSCEGCKQRISVSAWDWGSPKCGNCKSVISNLPQIGMRTTAPPFIPQPKR